MYFDLDGFMSYVKWLDHMTITLYSYKKKTLWIYQKIKQKSIFSLCKLIIITFKKLVTLFKIYKNLCKYALSSLLLKITLFTKTKLNINFLKSQSIIIP